MGPIPNDKSPSLIDLTSGRFIALLVLLAFLLPAELQAQRRRFRGAMGGAAWAPDGKHVVYQRKWYDARSWQEVKPVAQSKVRKPNHRAEHLAALSALLGRKVRGGELRASRNMSTLPRAPLARPGSVSSADGSAAATILDGVLYFWRAGGKARKLLDGLAGVRHFRMAPSGTAVCYIKGFDLFVVDTKSGKERRLTSNGSENFFNGELDWVYQEEVYGRYNFRGAWFSPTGNHVAFLRINEGNVDTFSIVDHIPDQLKVEEIKYPKSGRGNPVASLYVANSKTGKAHAFDLSRYDAKDEILIVRVGWTPEGDRAVFMVQNREQTWLDLLFGDPATGKTRVVIHESCDYGWTERLPMPRWLSGGRFLWESDRTGYRHYYLYGRDGKLHNAITKGNWSARSILRLDEKRGFVCFYGNEENYWIGQHAYFATLDGKKLVQVTKGRGTHRVSFNEDGTLVLDQYSSLENPGEQWLREVGGKDLRQIQVSKKPDTAWLPHWKQIRARDGEMLDVAYTLPKDFSPSKKYPVWINTYSGPAAPSLRDSWRGRGRAQWYVQLTVNVRSATQRGHKATTKCYRQFGVQETKDLEDAIDWLCKSFPWADKSRVGITGWSYGGYMTAYAMTHSDRFKCGIAGAGVYDWRLYDTIYTERYMATPQNNAAGYDLSSCVKAARNLKGQLLIVHGTMDDNVHMQNAIQFINALQRAGKMNFQFMLYAKSRHGVRSPHLGKLRQAFMRKHL